jgi:uncharacterized protein (DUF2147 family)
MKKVLFSVLVLFLMTRLNAQVTGTWKTIDDETNEAKSYVELTESGGYLSGKITKLLKSGQDKKCDACPGERKDKPILNMVIVENMKIQDGYFQGGKILDPEKGKWYNCKMWLKDGDPNVLVVRGFVGVFYRTQYWYRVQ